MKLLYSLLYYDNKYFIISDGHKERDIIEASIKLTKDDAPNLIGETLDELYFVIRNGNCQLVIENFKYVCIVKLNLFSIN